MDCFIGKFITEFFAKLGKNVNFESPEDVKAFIINLLKNNQIQKLSSGIKNEKIQLIANIFFETNYDNKELQKIKENIIINLLKGKKIDIPNEEKRIFSSIGKRIINLRGKIFQIIRKGINDLTIEEDPLNEVIFFELLNKEKKIINEFLSKYKIRSIKYEKNIFNQILCEYKSFDLRALTKIYNYLSDFDNYFTIYNMFGGLIINIENIFKYNKITNNNINLNYLYNLMDENVHFISIGFRKLSKDIENMNDKMKKLQETMKADFNNKMKKQQKDNDNIIANMNEKIQQLEKGNANMKIYYDNKIQKLQKDNNNKITNMKEDFDYKIQKLEKSNENMKIYYDNKIRKLQKDNDNKIANMKIDYDNKIQYFKQKEKELTNDSHKNIIEIDKLKNKLSRISNILKCPISKEIIRGEPVISTDGITYDKDKLFKWLINNDSDPITRNKISVNQLVTNFAVKQILEEFNKKE